MQAVGRSVPAKSRMDILVMNTPLALARGGAVTREGVPREVVHCLPLSSPSKGPTQHH